jgi:type IV pilus assembly protein PilY1
MSKSVRIRSGAFSIFATLVLTLVGGFSSPVFAAPPAGSSDLSPTPVDITVAVSPNVALTFDDSGSMSFGYMPDDATECSWRYANSDYNKIYYEPSVTYVPAVDEDGNSLGDVPFTAAPLDGFHASLGFGGTTVDLSNDYSLTKEWDRDADHDNNEKSSSCMPSSVHGTKTVTTSYPEFTCDSGAVGSVKDKGKRYYYCTKDLEGKDINTQWCEGYSNNPCKVAAFDQTRDVGYSHAYYAKSDGTIVDLTTITTGATVDGHTRTVAEEQQNFANWYSYYRVRNLMTKTAISRAFSKISDDVRVIWQTIWPNASDRPWSVAIGSSTGQNGTIDALVVKTVDPDTGAITYDPTVKNNFYSWLNKIESSNSTPDRAATVRVGQFFGKTIDSTNQLTTKNPYWNGKAAADGGTSLSCRKNFQILVTDGYWNESDSNVSVSSNGSEDGWTLPDGKAYATGTTDTKVYSNVDNGGNGINTKSLANLAFYYWATDLQSGIANDVKSVWNAGGPDDKQVVSNADYFNSKNDPATWQHLSQYIVTLGIPGNLTSPDDYPGLVSGSKSWTRAEGDTKSALDDMWHAAINSRGGYFSASNPQTLVDSLTAILNNVTQGNNTAVSGSLNTAVLTTGALSYATGYDSSDWSGSVTASAVDKTTATLGAPLWDAKDKLPVAASRKIFTGAYDSTDKTVSGVNFTWANLPAAQKTWLETTPYTATVETDDTLAQKRLLWLTGVGTDEGSGDDQLRTRANTNLGAVINSQAKYVAYPADGYRNTFPNDADGSVAAETTAALAANGGHSYEKFVNDHLDRTPMIYVGANDGMLHAFDASIDADTGNPTSTAGTEQWAYVPYSVYPNLSKLSSQDFKTRFVPTVDGSPVTRDVFFGGAWHTILVAGLRYGGRGVYALDISSTDSTDTTAAKKVLWEFTAESAGADVTDLDKGNNPANLGYTYGQPNIARLSSGKWVVLIPSGYFPTCDKQFSPQPCTDAAAASNTRSSLFVVDAGTGALIKEIRTPADVVSHGLSSPVVGDYNNDQIDDVAYAGDLDGNLWRFDLSNDSVTSTDSSTGVLQLFKPAASPVGAQPITVMPRLFPDPVTQNFIVVFGTGKYLTAADNVTDSSTATQSVYGIRDKASTVGGVSVHATTVTRADLTEQTLVETSVTNPDTNQTDLVRGISNVAVPAAKGGWYFDLDVQGADGTPAALGEKVVVTPAALFDTNRVVISTLIPRGNDACDPRRDGALMVVDAASGGSGDGLSYPSLGGATWYGTAGTNTKVAGARVKNPPTGGSLPVASLIGGGGLMIPGVELASGGTFKIDDAIWRRRSWRALNNDQ